MISNKKCFAHMLSLALVVCTTSAFVKGVLNEEKKGKPLFKKYRYYEEQGHADKDWIPRMVMKDMYNNVDDTPDIIGGLGEDSNMLLDNTKYPFPHNVLAYASYLVIENASKSNGWLSKRCNIELIQQLLDCGGDPEAKNVENGWFGSSNITESAQDFAESFICDKNKEKRLCAKKVNRLLRETDELTYAELAKLTDEELAYQDYIEYLKKPQKEK